MTTQTFDPHHHLIHPCPLFLHEICWKETLSLVLYPCVAHFRTMAVLFHLSSTVPLPPFQLAFQPSLEGWLGAVLCASVVVWQIWNGFENAGRVCRREGIKEENYQVCNAKCKFLRNMSCHIKSNGMYRLLFSRSHNHICYKTVKDKLPHFEKV